MIASNKLRTCFRRRPRRSKRFIWDAEQKAVDKVYKLKILKARKLDFDKAKNMWFEMLNWRKAYTIEDTFEMEEPEEEEGYDEIRGEIEMLQQCNHPNVVRYLGSYQGEEYFWIVMEYCGGGSVGDLMSNTDEPLEEHQIAYICREALKML